MNRAGSGQLGQSIRIAGLIAGSMLLLLAAAILDLSYTAVLLCLFGFALAILIPPALPRIVARTRELHLFSPSVGFPVAYIIWFVAGSINFVDVPLGLEGSPFDPIPARMNFLYAWGIIGYLCGLYVARKVPIRSGEINERNVDLAKMKRVVQFIFVGAVVFWVATILQFTLPVLHPSTAGETRLVFHGPFFQGFIWFGSTALVFSPVVVWLRGGSLRYDWFWVFGVPIIIALLILSLGGRSWVAAPLLTLIIARSFLKRQSVWKLVIAGVVIFCAFSLFGYYRENTGSNEAFLDQIGLPAPVAPFVYVGLYIRYTVDALRRITEIIPSQVPYQYGAITMMPLRTFLPGHQDMSDMFFKNLLGRDFEGSGQPATLLGPLYADFGWGGVFVGMALYGILLSRTYRRAKAYPTMVTVIFYAYWMQAVFLALYMDGFAYINIYLLPVFWAILFRVSAKPRLSQKVPQLVPIAP